MPCRSRPPARRDAAATIRLTRSANAFEQLAARQEFRGRRIEGAARAIHRYFALHPAIALDERISIGQRLGISPLSPSGESLTPSGLMRAPVAMSMTDRRSFFCARRFSYDCKSSSSASPASRGRRCMTRRYLDTSGGGLRCPRSQFCTLRSANPYLMANSS